MRGRDIGESKPSHVNVLCTSAGANVDQGGIELEVTDADGNSQPVIEEPGEVVMAEASHQQLKSSIKRPSKENVVATMQDITRDDNEIEVGVCEMCCQFEYTPPHPIISTPCLKLSTFTRL